VIFDTGNFAQYITSKFHPCPNQQAEHGHCAQEGCGSCRLQALGEIS